MKEKEQADTVYAVQKMQDYIEKHLLEPVTLYELAQAAGYSPFHCAKMFKEVTGKAPFEYIRKYRLSQAALTIRDEKRKIVDVAMDFLFDSHEGFTRAFHRQFGLSPKAYQKKAPMVPLFKPLPVREYFEYLQRKEQGGTKQEPLPGTFYIQTRIFPRRKLVFKRGTTAEDYFQYVEETDCDVWGMLGSVKEALYEPLGLWLPDSLRPEGCSRYIQGVEVPSDYEKEIPEGYEVMELPECEMMLFQGDPFPDDRFEEAVAVLSGIMDRFDPTTEGCQWEDDAGPRFQLEPQGWRGYIEGRPVRQL